MVMASFNKSLLFVLAVFVCVPETEGVALNDPCTINSNCTDSVANSVCETGFCKCDTGYQENSESCNSVTCSAITANNAYPDKSSVDYSGTVQYTCVTGYEHTSGDLTRTCQADGSLTGTAPVCTGNKDSNKNLDGCVSKAGALGAAGSRLKHTLPDLPYDYTALEPVISGDIMRLHHQKHHATYINNLNAAEEKLADAIQSKNIGQIIALQPALKFNGGGHINHSIFWENLSPNGGGKPKDDLMDAIKANFRSFDSFLQEMSATTVAIQGSGWGWLGYNPTNDRMKIVTCANQDPLQATTGLIPLFGIDVWEHAYYLQYKNVRADYVKAIFEVANWEDVGKRLDDARML